jgi:ectoine hydroxylase-related dioxygenase (phytanoyl-CoA dioxygenase family)
LEDFTKESGATRVVPGTHLSKSYPENGKKYPNELILEAPRGSVVVFNGALWHGSSEKMSSKTRWAAILSYGRWFIKPSFDITRNISKSIFDQLTDQQKELLGFKFNPPLDEFTRISARSTNFELPKEFYTLPN